MMTNTFQNRVLGKCLFGAVMLVCALWGAAARGASFDCGAARAPVEKLICADPELAALDDQLADVYRAALKNQDDAGRLLKGQQRQWLKSRADNLGADALKNTYRERVAFLRMQAGQFQTDAEFRFEKISKQRDFVLKTLVCPPEKGVECQKPAQLLIYDKGQSKPFQTIYLWNVEIHIPPGGDAPLVNSARLYDYQDVINVGDFNFDGQDDFGIQTGYMGSYSGPSYDIYLFDPKTGRYVYSAAMSELNLGSFGFFEFDTQEKRIYTFGKSGCCYHESTTYRVENNEPIAIERIIDDQTDADGRAKTVEETLVDGQWQRKITYSSISEAERQVLLDLYDSTHGDDWSAGGDGESWKEAGCFREAGTECEWRGVRCETDGETRVVAIELSENNLVGALPSLSGLTALKRLAVSKNRLSGNMPALTGMKALEKLDISQNQLTGGIPALDGLTALQMLDVSSNQLAGNIPPLAGLPKLEAFDASHNQLSGGIPALAGLANLGIFNVSHNRLAGPVPALPERLLLLGAYSDFSGNIPLALMPPLNGYGRERNMSVFDVSHNQLTGGIPTLPKLVPKHSTDVTDVALVTFDFSHNQLSGSLPALPRPLAAGVAAQGYKADKPRFQHLAFNASHNQLTGGLPALDGVIWLHSLVVSHNRLTGGLPPLQGLPELVLFDVSHNQLTGGIPSLKDAFPLNSHDFAFSRDGLNTVRGKASLIVSYNQLTGAPPAVPYSLQAGHGSELCPNYLSAPSPTDRDWGFSVRGSSAGDWHKGCTAPPPPNPD